jgi:ubiquinol-cytochrome c reductase iron-sulfur subunit
MAKFAIGYCGEASLPAKGLQQIFDSRYDFSICPGPVVRLLPMRVMHSRGVRRGSGRDLCDFRSLGPWRTCTPSTRVPINANRYVPSRLFRDRLRLDRPPTPGLCARVPSRGQAIPRQGRGLDVTTMSSAEPTRRDFLYIATASVGAVGAAAAVWPLIAQMNPDASTIAAGAPIEVDLGPIAVGQVIKVFWRGKPIFISHRSDQEISAAQKVDLASLPDPEPDDKRVKAGHEQWQVLIGICTHLGCIPIAHQGDYNGYFCPCHGSQYDTSGRIRRGPAPANLALPPYEFVSNTKIRIG